MGKVWAGQGSGCKAVQSPHLLLRLATTQDLGPICSLVITYLLL